MPKLSRESSVSKPTTMVTKEFIKTKDRVYLERVKPLIDDLVNARSRKDRICAIRDLQEYLGAWLQLMQHPTGKPSDLNKPKPPFWSRFLGRSTSLQPLPLPPSPPTKKTKLLVYMVPLGTNAKTEMPDTDFSLSNPSPSSVSVSSEHHSGTAKVESPSCKSVSMAATCVDPPSYTVVNVVADNDNWHEKEPASLHLMTCDSVENDNQLSVAVMSTAIVAYDSKKVYDSYHLQSVETQLLDQEGNDADTIYSTAPVSSEQASVSLVETNKDDAPATQRDSHAVILQEVLKQVTAMFEGSAEDMADCGLGVEILEVAPCDQNEPWVSLSPPAKKSTVKAPRAEVDTPPVSPSQAAGNDREEVESLRSTRSGLVRKMVDTFSRTKP